jgi:hypothetical protein
MFKKTVPVAMCFRRPPSKRGPLPVLKPTHQKYEQIIARIMLEMQAFCCGRACV